MENKTILFVDDEQNILRAFKRIFMESDYKILLANNGKEALDMMDKEAVDLIISDMRMPFMDGYKLLATVKEKYPNTIRVILSGFSEKETMLKCIQENLAMVYLLKPWDNEQLLLTIDSMLKIQQILKDNNMEEVANSLVDKFTVQDKLYDELMAQLGPEVDLDKIVGIIEQDFVLSAIILRFVNSTFHGSNIATVRKALEYMSLNELINIILSKKLNQTIHGDEKVERLKGFLWKHSGLRNIITHFIYKEIIGKEIPEKYRLAGLLQNMGMFVLLKIYQNEYLDIIHEAHLKGIPLVKVEKDRFGIDHQEAGGYLLNWWGLPFPIVETAFHHHNPDNPEIVNKELIHIAYISGHYAWVLLGHNSPEPITDAIFSSIGTTKEACDDLILNHFYSEKLENNQF